MILQWKKVIKKKENKNTNKLKCKQTQIQKKCHLTKTKK